MASKTLSKRGVGRRPDKPDEHDSLLERFWFEARRAAHRRDVPHADADRGSRGGRRHFLRCTQAHPTSGLIALAGPLEFPWHAQSAALRLKYCRPLRKDWPTLMGPAENCQTGCDCGQSAEKGLNLPKNLAWNPRFQSGRICVPAFWILNRSIPFVSKQPEP